MITREGQIRLCFEVTGDNRQYIIGLFKNAIVPDLDTVLADLVEADWGDYARSAINISDWAYPVDSGDGGLAVGPELKWIRTASGPDVTVYGFFILDHTGDLIIATNFGPVTVAQGEFVDLTINFALKAA